MKRSLIYRALAFAGVFGLALGPAEGVARGDGGDRPNIPLRSMQLKPYVISGNVTLTEQDHAGRVGNSTVLAAPTVTLPRSTGGGAIYRIDIGVSPTSASMIIKVGNGDDSMRGQIAQSGSAGAATIFSTSNSGTLATESDTITLNRTTTGGFAGDYIEIEDVSEGVFIVRGLTRITGTAATPFSATV